MHKILVTLLCLPVTHVTLITQDDDDDDDKLSYFTLHPWFDAVIHRAFNLKRSSFFFSEGSRGF